MEYNCNSFYEAQNLEMSVDIIWLLEKEKYAFLFNFSVVEFSSEIFP